MLLTAQTLMSTNPRGRQTSRIVSSVMSVGTLEAFFGQETQTILSGLMFLRRDANSRSSTDLSTAKT